MTCIFGVGGWEFFTIYSFRCERLDRLEERERGSQDATICGRNRKLPEICWKFTCKCRVKGLKLQSVKRLVKNFRLSFQIKLLH